MTNLAAKPDPIDTNQRSHPSTTEVLEYRGLIEKASKSRDCIDYPNSTVAHAEIAISQIIAACISEIGVFSRSFAGRFWNNFSVMIQDFLEQDNSRKFRVITIRPADSEVAELVSYLREKYPTQFALKTLRPKILKNPDKCINFLYGDDFASRYEEEDLDAKNGFVSGIVNFGNKSRVLHLKELYTKLYSNCD